MANPQTPTKKGKSSRSSRRKQQSPPDLSETDMEMSTTEDEGDLEPSLKSLITNLGNMSDRVAIHEQRLGSLTMEIHAIAQSFFTALAAPGTSRSKTERRVMTGPKQVVQGNFPDVSEEVWPRVARAPFLQTTDEGSVSRQAADPPPPPMQAMWGSSKENCIQQILWSQKG